MLSPCLAQVTSYACAWHRVNSYVCASQGVSRQVRAWHKVIGYSFVLQSFSHFFERVCVPSKNINTAGFSCSMEQF